MVKKESTECRNAISSALLEMATIISAPTRKRWQSRVTPTPMAMASEQEAAVLWPM